ncbi:hypothetical protein ABES25_02295 [Bacillus gobiensis]|uniref:hypothetical protein n=1 Tax=Bacillus gobiensis TaxID=1441095 RepID=UPI003D263D97
MSWQAGSKVDVFSARKAILPLVDLSLSSPEKVFKKLLQLNYDEAVMKRITIFIMNSLKHSTIVLSNGKIGEIVFYENDSLSRPLISVNEEIISLSQRNDLSIDYIK